MDGLMDGLMDCRPTIVMLGGAMMTHFISYLLTCTMQSVGSGNVAESLGTETVMWPMWLGISHLVRKIWGVSVEGLLHDDMKQFFDCID